MPSFFGTCRERRKGKLLYRSDPEKILSKSFCFPSKSDLLLLLPTQFGLNAMGNSFVQPLWEHLVQSCTCIKLIFDCLSAGMFHSGLVSLLSDLPPDE